jgi:hypothetical protein
MKKDKPFSELTLNRESCLALVRWALRKSEADWGRRIDVRHEGKHIHVQIKDVPIPGIRNLIDRPLPSSTPKIGWGGWGNLISGGIDALLKSVANIDLDADISLSLKNSHTVVATIDLHGIGPSLMQSGLGALSIPLPRFVENLWPNLTKDGEFRIVGSDRIEWDLSKHRIEISDGKGGTRNLPMSDLLFLHGIRVGGSDEEMVQFQFSIKSSK